MTQYTQGPWEYRLQSNVIAQVGGAVVCDANHVGCDDIRLITAAPRLYEALEKALPFLGSAATRSQIICGVDAGELYFVVEELLSEARGSHE